jgi:hypothetical protein
MQVLLVALVPIHDSRIAVHYKNASDVFDLLTVVLSFVVISFVFAHAL